MKRIVILGMLLFILTGCFSQHLYYDKSKYQLIIEDLDVRNGAFYLLILIKNDEKIHELCIDWDTFHYLYIKDKNIIDTTLSKSERDAQFWVGYKAAQKLIKKIYSGKQKYFEVDNVQESDYNYYLIDQEYYAENFKNKDLKEVLIRYTKRNIKIEGYEHRITVDSGVYKSQEGNLEEKSLIKYLIVNEFWVNIGGFNGRFSAFDRSKEGNKIPWKDCYSLK